MFFDEFEHGGAGRDHSSETGGGTSELPPAFLAAERLRAQVATARASRSAFSAAYLLAVLVVGVALIYLIWAGMQLFF